MARDWKRLGSYVARRRFAMGYATAGDLADALGKSGRTIERLESGTSVGRNTLLAIEHHFGWPPQTGEKILAGGSPPEERSPASPDEPELRDDAERKIWAITEIPEAHRRTLIAVHRAQLEDTQQTRRA